MTNLLLFLGAYLLGSIPFGLLLTKWFGKQDIRAIGSGNIGATNVLRTGSKFLALATLFLDGSKGAVAVWLGSIITGSPVIALWAGFIAVLGHNFPLWLKFKGGKGVATTFAVWLVFNWKMGMIVIGVWLMSFLETRYSSLSALLASVGAVIYAALLMQVEMVIPIALMALLIWLRHLDNIKRLLKGKEHKFGGADKNAP